MGFENVNSQWLKERAVNIFLNVLGSALLAFGVCAFVMPYNLIVGGATGISLIINRLFGISVSLVALVINVGVLPLGYFFGGKRLVLGSILSSLVYPAFLAVFESIPEISKIADNMIMAALCGGVVCGLGIGLVMKSGGSTGGVDIPVLIVHKLTKISVSKLMKVTDTVIMLLQIPLFGLTSIIYGLLYTYIMTAALNSALTMGEDCLRVSVVSEAYEQIREALISQDYGVTMVLTESGYTRTPVMKIESIMRQARYQHALKIIESVDSAAFVTVEHVKDVRGQGYTMDRVWIDLDD